jgi:iron complex outermembrane receptor protein
VKGLSAGVNVNTMINNATIFFLWKNDTSGAYMPAPGTLSDSRTYRTNIDPFVTYTTLGGSSHRLRTRYFNTTNENNTDQNSIGNLYYAEYQYQKRIKNSVTLTGGLVNVYSKVESQLYGYHTGNQSAAYIQGDLKWKRLIFSAGARTEKSKVDEFKDEWTPVFRSGINYHFLKETYVRASAGQGYRIPSIAERFIQTSIGGLVIFPNADLEPEYGQSYEIGIRQNIKIKNWIASIDVAVFENDYRNMMEFAFAQWGPITEEKSIGFKSLNVGKTRIRGVEVTVMGQGNVGELKINFQLGYTYLDPKQLTYDSAYSVKIGLSNVKGSDSSDFLKYRYRDMFKGDLEFNFRKISLGLSVRYNSRMKNIDNLFVNGIIDGIPGFEPGLGIADYRKYRTKGDVVFDLRTSYLLIKNLQIAIIAKNILNYIYMQRPADMQPPRSVALQASLKF